PWTHLSSVPPEGEGREQENSPAQDVHGALVARRRLMVTCAGSAAADFGPSWLTGDRRSWATATLPCRCRPFQARAGNCAPPHSAGAAGGANGTAPRPSEEDRGAAELLRSGGVLRREVARERGVERDTRAHRRRHGRLGDVAPLRRGRL